MIRFALRSELLKIRSGRTALVLAVVAVTLVATSVSGNGKSMLHADDPHVAEALADSVRLGFGSLLVASIFGALIVTGEYRHGTLARTLVSGPSRTRTAIAKSLSAAVYGLVLGVLSAATALVATVLTAKHEGVAFHMNHSVKLAVAGVVAVNVLAGPLGAAIGWILRNQVVTVVGITLYTLALEPALESLVPQVHKWLPGGAEFAVIGDQGDLLSPRNGIFLLLAWIAVVSTASLYLLNRRDVTVS